MEARLSPITRPAAELDLCIRAPAAPRYIIREQDWASFMRSHYPRSYEVGTVCIGWCTAENTGMASAEATHTCADSAQADAAQTALPNNGPVNVAETISQLRALRRYLRQSMHTGSNTPDHPHDNLHVLGGAAAGPATFDQQLCNLRYTHGASRGPSVPKLMSQF
jgi:hypothetical protein